MAHSGMLHPVSTLIQYTIWKVSELPGTYQGRLSLRHLLFCIDIPDKHQLGLAG